MKKDGKSKEIKAIDTVWDGNLFRSRLEARWAVFFKTLGIKYEYEPEGFELGDGLRYLPDFRLPEHKCWIEIKGCEPSEKDLLKIKKLNFMTEEDVHIFIGDPYCNTTWMTQSYIVMNFSDEEMKDFMSDPIEYGSFHGKNKACCQRGCTGLMQSAGYGTSEACGFNWGKYTDHPELIHEAYAKARQARFEHRESG